MCTKTAGLCRQRLPCQPGCPERSSTAGHCKLDLIIKWYRSVCRCEKFCKTTPGCTGFTFQDSGRCWFKAGAFHRVTPHHQHVSKALCTPGSCTPGSELHETSLGGGHDLMVFHTDIPWCDSESLHSSMVIRLIHPLLMLRASFRTVAQRIW